jgi:hypothetical protein
MHTQTNIHSGLCSGSYPYGSYLKSCYCTDYRPYTLTAQCTRDDGSKNYSSLQVPGSYKDIVNCDGVLKVNEC